MAALLSLRLLLLVVSEPLDADAAGLRDMLVVGRPLTDRK